MDDDVKKSICRPWFLTFLVLLAPTISSALGLGKLHVLSLLGQPFNAEIELVSVQPDELLTLSAQLASREAYRRSDLQYGAAAAGLHFKIERRADGHPFIRLTSERTIDEPFIDLVVELNWASGRLLREYTALMNPGNYAPAKTPGPAPTIAAQTRAAPMPLAPPSPDVVMPMPTIRSARIEYGPVKRGETLSKIASNVKSENISLEQMMIGILRNNPNAFINQNINRLKANEILYIPETEQLIQISHSEAAREVMLHAAKRSLYARNEAKAANAKSPGKNVRSQRPNRKKAVEKPVLRLSSASPINKAPASQAVGGGVSSAHLTGLIDPILSF